MSYKVYKSQNYFVVHDTTTNEDVIRQVRNLVRWEKKGTLYSFYYNTPNLTTVGNAIVRLGSVYEFSDLVDSTGTAWASQSSLDLFLEQWTGHICCPTTGEDALYNLYNSVPTLLSTGAIPSGSTSDISAPNGTINIKKTGDGTISSQSVPSGATIDYSVADNDITVNGANDFTIHATDSLDIVLKDTTGATVTPDSVTPHAGTHHVDIVLPANSPNYASARLLKTGQTVSYRTNDDGDLEAGRNASFLTLLANNPFGNTNRFTDILGGRTYATAIVLDWSTYDGVSVLGYTKGLNTVNVDWNGAVDGASTTSIGSFTSGWRLTNINELGNIVIYGGVTITILNYAPFNITDDRLVWSSTTAPFSKTNAFTLATGNAVQNVLAKTSAFCRYIACRNFTVSGTTIS